MGLSAQEGERAGGQTATPMTELSGLKPPQLDGFGDKNMSTWPNVALICGHYSEGTPGTRRV